MRPTSWWPSSPAVRSSRQGPARSPALRHAPRPGVMGDSEPHYSVGAKSKGASAAKLMVSHQMDGYVQDHSGGCGGCIPEKNKLMEPLYDRRCYRMFAKFGRLGLVLVSNRRTYGLT